MIIEDITGVGPFVATVDSDEFTITTLPDSIQLPIGSGDITITDAQGCSTTSSYELITGQLSDQFEIMQSGDQLIITGELIDSISWTPSESLSCSDCLDPIADPNITTVYTATVSVDECLINLEYRFEVIDETPDYLLPSVFSPNNDGQNDNFTLFMTSGATGIPVQMEIFDRWGNRIYSETDPTTITTTGWDGTNNGDAVSAGVYVYRIVVEENSEIINLYGDLTVVR